MKRYFLSSLVVIFFIAYSFYKRSLSTEMPVLPAPQNNTNNSVASQATQTPPTAITATALYKDGIYIGDTADAFYGNIQVKATISGGKISNIQFLQFPNDRDTSIAINQQADPILAQEAIQTQSAQVDIVSGATDSSNAFIQSLQSALNKAK